MKPVLYDKTGTIKLGELTNCIECLVEEERNGLFEVSLIYPTNDTLFNSLEEENIIVCNANDTLLNQKFRIYLTRKLMNNKIEVFARHISFDLAYDIVDSINIENQSCEYALNTIFRNSKFSTHYKGYSDIINAQNYSINRCNCIEAIAGTKGSIIDTFGTGAEILRDNTNIHVLNKRGYDNGVSVEYAKNLTGFELEEDYSELITRIIPFAIYTNNESDEEVLVEADAIDSNLITNYSHPYISYMDFSDKFEDEEVPTTEKLMSLAEKYFKDNNCDKPKQNFKIEFIPLSKCVGYEGIQDNISLCDTVTIKDTRYNINTQAKVIKVVYDVLKDRYDSIELGEPRTTLGDIINSSGGSEGSGEQGPPGPQGPPGQDGSIGDFPNSLPSTPVLNAKVYGFASIELNWTYENKVYYNYELYGSKTKDFTPNTFDLIHAGQTSSYLFQAKPNETWYFRVCAINTHGERTPFSDQVVVTTTKIDDMSNYFEDVAIGNAVVGALSSDYMEAGIIKGHYIDAKNLSVTDGNGKRTLDIDSFGNVNLDVTSLKISSSNVATQEYIQSELNKIPAITKIQTFFYLSDSPTKLIGGTWATTSPTDIAPGKYVWTKTVTHYKDNTTTESEPFCIATMGANGVGVNKIYEYYLVSSKSEGIYNDSPGWSKTVPTMTSTNKYLWNMEEVEYTDGTIETTDPVIIGAYGETGADGKGIKKIYEYYLATDKNEGIYNDSPGWSAEIPTMTSTNRFLWNMEEVEYTDGSYSTTDPVIIGVYGENGSDGVGIEYLCALYYLSTSKTELVDGWWSDVCPQWESGKYLWICYYIYYSDGSETTTEPFVDASWEKVNDLEDSVNNIIERVVEAEHKITDDAIISTVTSSTKWAEQSTYIDELGDYVDYTYQYADSNASNIWELSERVNQAEFKITDEAIVSTVTSSTTYKDALTGKVDTNKVISSINQTAEAIKINANKIQLEGAVTAGDTNNNYIKIENANYTAWNNQTPKAFFGFRAMSDSTYDKYVVPKFLLSAHNAVGSTYEAFIVTPYKANDNPQGLSYGYVDLAYRTNVSSSSSSKLYSNMKMYGNGDVRIDAVKNFEVTSNYNNGTLNSGGGENRIALFTTSGYDWLDEHIQTGGISNHNNSYGLILTDRYYSDSWDGSQTGGGSKITSVRVGTDSAGDKFFRPTYENGVIQLGSGSLRWKTVYSVNALNASSDRNLKENIEYLCNVPNPNAKTSTEITTSDMYDFVKDDLYISRYNFKGESEEKIGFIAQDIIDTKVGSKIITYNREADDTLGYDTSNYANVLAGALKEAINEIEKLKEEINILKGGA